jgi:hypothetical protein
MMRENKLFGKRDAQREEEKTGLEYLKFEF